VHQAEDADEAPPVYPSWRELKVARRAMLTWIGNIYGLGKAAALTLASPVLHLRVTQVANESWGVHALLPWDAIA
jgi:acetamidase/formamidase